MNDSNSDSDVESKTPPLAFPKPHKGGLILFGSFVALYGACVAAKAVVPDSMSDEVIPGINFAVAGGVGIIFATFLIAALYSWIRRVKSQNKTDVSQS